MENTFIDRLGKELEGLTDKHDKLLTFLGTEKFYALSVDHQCLLRAQFGAMSSYLWILHQRLNLLRGN